MAGPRAEPPRQPTPQLELAAPFRNQPWLAEAGNSWGLRDSERTIAKPPGAYRALFVGDSFVESRFTPLSLAVQQRVPAKNKIEAVSLDVGATDSRSYYYRIRDVALALQPDAELLFIYSGNDFVQPGDGYSIVPRVIDESPGVGLIGMALPRTSWLLVNRLGMADFFRSQVRAAGRRGDRAVRGGHGAAGGAPEALNVRPARRSVTKQSLQIPS